VIAPTAPLTFLTAALVGAGVTWMARHTAWRLGIVNHPNPIVPQHTRPTAYLGGLGIAGGTLGALLVAVALGWTDSSLVLRADLLTGSVLFLALGIADDLRPLRPQPKFALQAAAAGVVIYLRTELATTGMDMLLVFLCAVWIVTVVNAVNMTDVCDGLVAGLACIQFVTLAMLTPLDSLWALAIAGSCVGFLVFNAPSASIFLGDGGTHLLGFWLAALTLDLGYSSGRGAGLLQVLLIGGVPLFELIFVSSMRIRKKIPWWRGSPDHFSLRLQAAGFSRWATDGLAWTAMLLLAGAALIIERVAPLTALAVVVSLSILATWCWTYLQSFEVTPRTWH
jgi:UDP-GlcNAc:undecaprenyl-phosphate GlcNAc-1-phosphate transferase